MITDVQVIPGIETAVRSMKVGGIRRVVIPPSQGYQNTSQEPLPPNVCPPLSFSHYFHHIQMLLLRESNIITVMCHMFRIVRTRISTNQY